MPQSLVIVGAGFAGVWSALAAKHLANTSDKTDALVITVIAPEPVLVMRPRLYEAEPSTLVHPLGALFKDAGIKFIPGIVKTIDTENRMIEIQSASATDSSVRYDRLILAAGSSVVRPKSVDGLQEHAFDIDSLEGAVKLDTHLQSLQSAPASPGSHTVVVCGAGFTGIEIASELPTRLSHVTGARIILVSNTSHIAPDFGAGPRSIIEQQLRDLGVEFKLGHRITSVDADSVTLDSGERIESKTAIWTAGVSASSLTHQIPAPRDRLGRLCVDENLRVPSVDGVYATGDTASAIADGKTQYALMSCQHANQLGRVSGYNAAADLLGEPLVAYSQPEYNCCLDLGSDGALVARGWQRDSVIVSGTPAKKVKSYINHKLIYPAENAMDALIAAHPGKADFNNLDEAFDQMIQIAS
ncbi:pyridine nucleotide-disulfide oxidoreductase family protein [Phaeosphaeria sp. MPI-PUGE-AT-0046c]|nr:pyridine nucleotide-disulfide oxidoreductase family protein [Phaeosphaeria sp. MPI-PUGE-AT-0046c]